MSYGFQVHNAQMNNIRPNGKSVRTIVISLSIFHTISVHIGQTEVAKAMQRLCLILWSNFYIWDCNE